MPQEECDWVDVGSEIRSEAIDIPKPKQPGNGIPVLSNQRLLELREAEKYRPRPHMPHKAIKYANQSDLPLRQLPYADTQSPPEEGTPILTFQKTDRQRI
jgi:hypothetical protein